MRSNAECLISPAAALIMALSVGACGAGPTEPTVPSIVGEYAGTWTYAATLGGQPAAPISCACSLSVPAQSEGRFWANSQLSGSPALVCDQILGITEGQVAAGGSLTFRLSADYPPGSVNSEGCRITMPPFTGSFSGNRITASRTEVYDCRPAGGREDVQVLTLTVTRR